jgi:hypothetical protein
MVTVLMRTAFMLTAKTRRTQSGLPVHQARIDAAPVAGDYQVSRASPRDSILVIQSL